MFSTIVIWFLCTITCIHILSSLKNTPLYTFLETGNDLRTYIEGTGKHISSTSLFDLKAYFTQYEDTCKVMRMALKLNNHLKDFDFDDR